MTDRKDRLKFDRDRKIYDRQTKEGDKPWKAFTFYRDLGAVRTIRGASDLYREEFGLKTSKHESTQRVLQTWSSRWKWKERVHEWERFLDQKKRQKAITLVEQMKDRHIKLGNSLQVLGAQELQKWILKVQAGKKVQISVGDLLRSIEAGVKLERLSRGEPETVAEERRVNDADLTRKSLVNVLEDDAAMEALDVVMTATTKEDEDEDEVVTN